MPRASKRGRNLLLILGSFLLAHTFWLTAAQPHRLMHDYDRAWQLTGQLRTGEAIPLLKKIIATDKTFYRAYATLAEAHWIEKSPEKAEAYFIQLEQNLSFLVLISSLIGIPGVLCDLPSRSAG